MNRQLAQVSSIMDLFSHPGPCCASNQVYPHTRYPTQAHGSRTIYHCRTCDIYFSETFATPIAGLTNSGYGDDNYCDWLCHCPLGNRQ